MNTLAIGTTTPSPAETGPKELQRAAKQFETMLLRTMLSQLEKSTHISSQGGASGGSSVYSSMVVDALAEAIADAGGIGLAEKVAEAMASGSKA